MYKRHKFSELFTIKLALNHQVGEYESDGLAFGPSVAEVFYF